jgi:hypothetical protein
MITHLALGTRPSRRILGLIVIGGAIAAPLLSAGPAFGATNAASQSCWENVDTGETGCFDSALDEQQQIELATGRPLVAQETGTAGAARSFTSPSATAAVDYLLVTGWDGINKTGDTKSYFTSNVSVCNGFGYSFQNLLTFNDRFESIQSFNGCVTTLYDAVDFDGPSTSPIATSNNLGAFNNRASSLDVE